MQNDHKKMTTAILLILLNAFSSHINPDPQKECKVLLESIFGSYEGDCRKGLADGTGTSRGKDVYTGEFKKGFPDGMGRYIWKDGSYYSGDFVKGKKDGYGEMVIRRKDRPDSLVNGYWTQDVYMGASNVAFAVRQMVNVKDVRFEKKSDNGAEIFIVFQQDEKPVGAEGLRVTNQQGAKAMSEFDYSVLRKISFPFLGTKVEFRSRSQNGVSIKECAAEFDIYEKGVWQVTVAID